MIHNLNFAAIDFETANSDRASACAVAVVTVEEGKVKHIRKKLFKPENMQFDSRNTRMHGIRREHVENAPSFLDIWDEFEMQVRGLPLLAHNAAFDISILNYHLERGSRSNPVEHYVCTCELAEMLLPGLDNHKLATLTELFGIDLDHHDPASDALACAELGILFDRMANPDGISSHYRSVIGCGKSSDRIGFIDVVASGVTERQRTNQHSSICRECGAEVPTGTGVRQRVKSKWHVQCLKCFKPIGEFKSALPDNRFSGMRFVFTGDLDALTREQCKELIPAQGGRVTGSVSKFTDYVVAGDKELKDYDEFGKSTGKLDDGYRLMREGEKVKVIDERQFLEMIT